MQIYAFTLITKIQRFALKAWKSSDLLCKLQAPSQLYNYINKIGISC